ncbi:glycine cleavage system protein GcvH [Thaumasiovibrio sp. DFM-14]|uniref:glycine cleavage system protein GcvH n=1 Tax=Thaumasiovibrio sp. DFM-14 TaxID=3384792 RepID=UPI0039A354C6
MENGLRFTASHEWVRDNGDGTVTVGISEPAQALLGDVVFVELPEIGMETTLGDAFSLVESVKAASDVYAPVNGEVLEVNDELEDSPELVNEEPYAGGWIAKIKLRANLDIANLLDEEAYLASQED